MCCYHLELAGRHVQPNCLEYILSASPDILASDYRDHRKSRVMYAALEGGSSDCIACLERAGCTWHHVIPPGLEVVFKRNPAPLLLECPHDTASTDTINWEHAMRLAISANDAYTMSVLYELGFESFRRRHHGWGDSKPWHPVTAALERKNVACLRLAVEQRELPLPHKVYACAVTLLAATNGKEMLQWVWGLGLSLHPVTAVMCARKGDVGALSWLFETCTVMGFAAMCEAAVMGNSLKCLRFAQRRGCRKGFISETIRNMAKVYEYPSHQPSCPIVDESFLLNWSAKDVNRRLDWDVDMLRYLVQHMDSAWASLMLRKVAKALEHALRWYERAKNWKTRMGLSSAFSERKVFNESDIDAQNFPWHVLIFLARKLRDKLPEGLSKMAAIRSERTIAFAGVIYKAGKLSKEGLVHPALPSWTALSRLPSNLQERIAHEAHIAIPACCLPL